MDITSATSASLQSLAARAAAAQDAALPAAGGAAPAAPGTAAEAPRFGQLVGDFLRDVNQQQLESDAAVEALATGRAENVHQVVLTAIKADLSVRMLLEIRNQLVQSYQEVMRMQL